MTHTSTKIARIYLTPEQIDNVKKQTGFDHVPEIVHLTVSELVEKDSIDALLIEKKEMACGLIHEHGRT